MAETPDYVEVDPDVPWAVGTELRLRFRTVGITFLTAAQIAIAERNLEKEDRFEVLRHSMPTSGFLREFYFDVKVRKPAEEKETEAGMQYAGMSGAIIAKVIVAAFAIGILWLSLKSVEVKVQKEKAKAVTAAGEAAEKSEGFMVAAGDTILKAAAAIAVVLVLWRGK